MNDQAILRRLRPDDVHLERRDPVDGDAYRTAARIVDDVKHRGDAALREYARRFDDVAFDAPIVLGRDVLARALESIDEECRDLLLRMTSRVDGFARAQRAAMTDAVVDVPGGQAGHEVVPVERAGCYAPGGRFALPSSVIMTAATARAAGVEEIWVASPRPTQVTLAAAACAGADSLLAVGGAQAIAALAYGAGDVPPCDAVVGPGNVYVTAAKQLVAGRVAIDMLAGPSELVVFADDSADASLVAADLLAQAEHDPLALPVLVTTSERLADAVDKELRAQIVDLPTAPVATAALARGFTCVARDRLEAVAICNRIAPEHLQLALVNEEALLPLLRHYGALFRGGGAAEVLGDYGAGPNHTLPTGGTARSQGGLSVFSFLRVRTWMRIDDIDSARPLVEDSARLARLEGLEAHARAAERRLRADGFVSFRPEGALDRGPR